MHKFPINEYKKYNDLPFDRFNTFKFSVYLIDFNWNYLFVNQFVKDNLGSRADDLIGKNMWVEFPELALDPVFNQMKVTMERGNLVNMNTTSPVTQQRLNITGFRLEDCYYFSASQIPDKEELINELRRSLKSRSNQQPGHK